MTDPTPKTRWYRLTPDRCVVALLALEGLLLLSEWFVWFAFNQHKGWTVLICLATVGAALVLMFLWFLAALVFRWRFQFSLLALLLLAVVVAVPFSWLATEMKAAGKQREAVEAIKKADGMVFYDYEYDPSGNWKPGATPPGPPWLRNLLGDNLLMNVTVVEFNPFIPVTISEALLDHIKGLTQLQRLDLTSTNASDAWLEQLKGLNHLRRLCLGGTRVSDTGMQHLRGLTQLRWLSLRGTKVGDGGLQNLSGLTQLQSLDLGGTKVSNAGMQHLKGLTQLQWLSLRGTRVSDVGLEDLKGLCQFQWLYLDDTMVSDAWLEHLEGLTQLRGLGIDGAKVTDTGLEHLARLTQLEVLYLGGAAVSDAGLQRLKGLTQLQRLSLKRTRVSDAGLGYLKGMTQLQWLNLSNTEVSDVGLEHLKGLPQLLSLFLRGTKVGDAGLQTLKGMTQLCNLDLYGTKVSGAARRRSSRHYRTARFSTDITVRVPPEPPSPYPLPEGEGIFPLLPRGRKVLDLFLAAHRDRLDLLRVEVHLLQVHHADAAVGKGAEVETAVRQVRRARPQRIVGHLLAVLHAAGGPQRDVELVEEVKRLQDALAGGLHRQGRLRKRHRADKSRWRREIAGQPQHAAPLAEPRQLDARELDRRHVGHRQVDVVAQVRDVPIEARRIGDHAQGIFVDLQGPVDVLQHDAMTAGVVDHVVARRGNAQVLLHRGADADAAGGLQGLRHRGASAQQVDGKLPGGDGPREVCGVTSWYLP